MVLVGDRGLITSARIAEELIPAGLDWLTALRAPAIQKLLADGPLQVALFDERDLAEIDSPDYPGERLVVFCNPVLAEERARRRAELLEASEQELRRIQARVRRAREPLKGADKIGLTVGAVLGRRKVAKHFTIMITDYDLDFLRDAAAIAAEAALDGFYVLRTTLPADSLSAADTVRAYKSLARVERAFRSLKTVDLGLRPVFHRTASRLRAHVLLCMLAYYLEWHMRQALAPILFDDHDRAAGEALRPSPVAKVQPSPAARCKAKTKQTDDGIPFTAAVARRPCHAHPQHRPFRPGDHLPVLATPTEIQRPALDLLGLKPTL